MTEAKTIYRCNGPKRRITDAALEKIIAKYLKMDEEGKAKLTDDHYQQFALMEETKGSATYGVAAVDLGGHVFGRDTEGPFERDLCGYNVTELIEAIPIDGEPHEVRCPKCGTVGSHVRTPVDVLAETEA